MENQQLFIIKKKYPYVASEQRIAVILDNMNNLREGMNVEQVIELMSALDEVNPFYT